MAQELRIHPLDLEPNVAIGLDLPMTQAGYGGFKLNYTTIDQGVANARNLLLTDRGERRMQPTFGCDLRRSVFATLTAQFLDGLQDNIRTNFAFWLPYLHINRLDLVPAPDLKALGLYMELSLDQNQFDTRSIQINISQSPNA